MRLHAHLLSVMRSREYQWFQFQNGVLDETAWRTYRKRKANNALAQRGLMCSMLMVPGDSASMSSTVVAPGSFVNTSRKYA